MEKRFFVFALMSLSLAAPALAADAISLKTLKAEDPVRALIKNLDLRKERTGEGEDTKERITFHGTIPLACKDQLKISYDQGAPMSSRGIPPLIEVKVAARLAILDGGDCLKDEKNKDACKKEATCLKLSSLSGFDVSKIKARINFGIEHVEAPDEIQDGPAPVPQFDHVGYYPTRLWELELRRREELAQEEEQRKSDVQKAYGDLHACAKNPAQARKALEFLKKIGNFTAEQEDFASDQLEKNEVIAEFLKLAADPRRQESASARAALLRDLKIFLDLENRHAALPESVRKDSSLIGKLKSGARELALSLVNDSLDDPNLGLRDFTRVAYPALSYASKLSSHRDRSRIDYAELVVLTRQFSLAVQTGHENAYADARRRFLRAERSLIRACGDVQEQGRPFGQPLFTSSNSRSRPSSGDVFFENGGSGGGSFDFTSDQQICNQYREVATYVYRDPIMNYASNNYGNSPGAPAYNWGGGGQGSMPQQPYYPYPNSGSYGGGYPNVLSAGFNTMSPQGFNPAGLQSISYLSSPFMNTGYGMGATNQGQYLSQAQAFNNFQMGGYPFVSQSPSQLAVIPFSNYFPQQMGMMQQPMALSVPNMFGTFGMGGWGAPTL